MLVVIPTQRCGRPGCEVDKTGVCLEGNTPSESCPFFGKATVDVPEDFEDQDNSDTSAVQHSIEPNRVSLPSGEALTLADVDHFLLWKPVKFVTIVGELDSGKTTLICALYDRFLRGSFAGHLFGGSRTLVGLEKNSHHARIESGRTVPTTPRTSLSDGLKYFHFSLVSEENIHSRVELMLSDRAGEHYQKARNNSDVVSELIEVKKAHHVVLLLDGGRIANPVYRSGAMQAIRQTIRVLLDGGALSNTSSVQVVTTKVDLLVDHPNKDAINGLLEKFRTQLKTDFGERLGTLSFWEVAARDPKRGLPPAHGLEKLLVSWCASRPIVAVPSPLRIPLHTEFDRLLSRTPMGVKP